MWNGEEKVYYDLEIKHETLADGTQTTEESASGRYTMNVSQEFFDTIYPDRKTVQGAVYIKDYAYTDRVIKQLTDMGYEAISVFRLGAVAYDVEIVYERLTSVCVAAGALLALFTIGVVLLALMMKTKQRDDTILHLLGMKHNVIRKINMLYFTGMLVGSGILSVLLMHVLKAAEVKQVVDLEKYFMWPQYLIFGVILAVLGILLGRRYMKQWKSRI
ncbi:MAG: hypothetical protein E7269_05050 [Lachnospiraceae bacterium]|nr:hypothetical protein [Lachnospiraceae bacterium]